MAHGQGMTLCMTPHPDPLPRGEERAQRAVRGSVRYASGTSRSSLRDPQQRPCCQECAASIEGATREVGAWNTLIEEAAATPPEGSAERGAKRRLDFAPLAGS